MLKAKFVELGDNDEKARAQILGSLSACDFLTLSRKLLHRFKNAKGRMFAIIDEALNLDQLEAYDRVGAGPLGACVSGTYSDPYPIGRRVELLVAFARDHLRTTQNGIILCELWQGDNGNIAAIAEVVRIPPQVARFAGDEVYYVVTPDVDEYDTIEAAVEGSAHWQTNVFSSCARAAAGDIPDEAFFDEIVRNAKHISVEAFDGDGYLIWSPLL